MSTVLFGRQLREYTRTYSVGRSQLFMSEGTRRRQTLTSMRTAVTGSGEHYGGIHVSGRARSASMKSNVEPQTSRATNTQSDRHFQLNQSFRVRSYLIEADFGAVCQDCAADGLLEDVSQWQVADMRVIGAHVQRPNPLLQTRCARAEDAVEF